MPLVLDAVTGTWKVQAGGGGGGGAPTSYSDYDTALAALRGGSASDGDLYLLDSGLLFKAYVSEGPGILIPADLYDSMHSDGHITGATNSGTGIADPTAKAYFTGSDPQATMESRGWEYGQTNSSSLKQGTDPTYGDYWHFDSSASGTSNASWSFYPTNPIDGCFAILRLKVTTNSSVYSGQCACPLIRVGGATAMPEVWVSPFKRGIADGFCFSDGTSTGEEAQASILKQDSPAPTWIVVHLDTNSTPSSDYYSYVRKIEPMGVVENGHMATEISNLNTNTAQLVHLRAFKGGVGSQAQFYVYEAHFFRI